MLANIVKLKTISPEVKIFKSRTFPENSEIDIIVVTLQVILELKRRNDHLGQSGSLCGGSNCGFLKLSC